MHLQLCFNFDAVKTDFVVNCKFEISIGCIFSQIVIMFLNSVNPLCLRVTNYHVTAKLAADQSGLQRCKVYLADARGNGFHREGKVVGVDPTYDLAALKGIQEGR